LFNAAKQIIAAINTVTFISRVIAAPKNPNSKNTTTPHDCTRKKRKSHHLPTDESLNLLHINYNRTVIRASAYASKNRAAHVAGTGATVTPRRYKTSAHSRAGRNPELSPGSALSVA
jgi:hypothetical protein